MEVDVMCRLCCAVPPGCPWIDSICIKCHLCPPRTSGKGTDDVGAYAKHLRCAEYRQQVSCRFIDLSHEELVRGLFV